MIRDPDAPNGNFSLLVNKAEYLILLRPAGLIARYAGQETANTGSQKRKGKSRIRVLQRAKGGVITIPAGEVPGLLATDPSHELDLELKRKLAVFGREP
jgi:hypothetical protein